MNIRFKRFLAASLTSAALVGSMAACGTGGGNSKDGANGELTLWTHNAGNPDELGAIQSVVDAYNQSQSKVKVKVQAFPQDSYND